MVVKSQLHKTVSLLISITLLIQLIIPVLPLSQTTINAYAETDENEYQTGEMLSKLETGRQLYALTDPISISRVQSGYQTGENITISYIVTNNQSPVRAPVIPESATVTDTIDILAAFDPALDANTIRDVSLETTLTAVTFIDSSLPPSQNGSTLTWDLDDLLPQESRTVTLTVQPPPSAADFTDLDSGALISGTLWGAAVSDTARPAGLAPDSIDPATLQTTVDADLTDKDMLWKTAEFTQDPTLIFDFVKSMGYDPYKGSLRGTRGTLWGETGNSVDQSSLLIAALRAAGIPARYRHGTLSTPDAQTLLASMFPPASGEAGYLPAGLTTADPLNDPDLLTLAQDHWWVEAYLPGSGWTNLDPSFDNAAVGDLFADSIASDGTDRLAELPDTLRHQINIRLKVEQYSTFPIGGVNLVDIFPLDITFATAQLASKRLTFAHLVDSEGLGGVFTSITHTYTPYFAIEENDITFLGDSFLDLISNFPLSSVFTTAEWLEYEIHDPDGNVENFTRTVKDLIGLDTRVSGGPADISVGNDSPPFALPDDLYVNWVLPNNVPDWVYQRQRMNLLPTMVQLGQDSDTLRQIEASTPPGANLSPEDSDTVNRAQGNMLLANEFLLTGIGLDFAWKADQAVAQIEEGLHTKMYYGAPRLFTVASISGPTGVVTQTIDLRRTTAAAIVAPGQAEAAVFSAQWAKGLIESDLEGEALEQVYGTLPLTTGRVFDEMEIQGIQPILITPNEYDLLDIYPFSPEVQALVTTALNDGKNVLIPSEPVNIDGQDVFGWWEFNPLTGETISVMDDGLHSAAIPYKLFESLLLFGVGQATSTSPGTVISFYDPNRRKPDRQV